MVSCIVAYDDENNLSRLLPLGPSAVISGDQDVPPVDVLVGLEACRVPVSSEPLLGYSVIVHAITRGLCRPRAVPPGYDPC